jgi:hypothetical protein
LVGSLLLA